MAKTAIDRRAARTRATLQRAHMALILEKGYDATTITDICTAADVGRSTFYAHYAGKDDLKRDGLAQLRALLVARQREALRCGRRFGFTLALFEHARDHLALYRALAGSSGGAVALGAIRAMLCDLVRGELPADSATPRAVAVQYHVGAIMAVLTWWLDGGATLPPVQIDTLLRRVALTGS
jgi:AcrR family transcriptional regulator